MASFSEWLNQTKSDIKMQKLRRLSDLVQRYCDKTDIRYPDTYDLLIKAILYGAPRSFFKLIQVDIDARQERLDLWESTKSATKKMEIFIELVAEFDELVAERLDQKHIEPTVANKLEWLCKKIKQFLRARGMFQATEKQEQEKETEQKETHFGSNVRKLLFQ